MRRLRLVAPCVVVACVVGATWLRARWRRRRNTAGVKRLRKLEDYTGGFTNSGCTTKSEAKRVSTNGTRALKQGRRAPAAKGWKKSANMRVACSSESSTGEYTGTKEGKNIVVKFKGCEVTPFVCTSRRP